MASSFAALIKDVSRNSRPDVLFAEPSGMVTTQELRDAASIALRDIAYDIGSFITLIDGPDFEYVWEERRDLLMAQISGADLVAISRADLLSPRDAETVMESLKDFATNLAVLSVYDGRGIDTVLATTM